MTFRGMCVYPKIDSISYWFLKNEIGSLCVCVYKYNNLKCVVTLFPVTVLWCKSSDIVILINKRCEILTK